MTVGKSGWACSAGKAIHRWAVVYVKLDKTHNFEEEGHEEINYIVK